MAFNFQQYFSYIDGFSFIGGGIWSTRRKIPDMLQITDKTWISNGT
jgi:hypothetical protein